MAHTSTRRSGAWLLAPVLGLASCSGAEPQDVLTPTSTAATADAGSSTGAPGGGGSSTGEPPATRPGGGAAAACAPEEEPNDDPDEANVLAPARCGAISPAGDDDFLTFQVSDTAKGMSLRYEGKVTLEVKVEGADTVVLGGAAGSPPVPFVRGTPYLVRVRGAERADSTPWRVEVVER